MRPSTILVRAPIFSHSVSKPFQNFRRRKFILPTAAVCLGLVASTSNFTPVRAYHTDFSSMSHTTTREKDGVIIVSPRDESKQSALVVICHGLGDTAEGFVDVAQHIANEMPHIKFILPTAPTQPVTMNMGMPMPSWYDIVGLDERSNEKCHGIDKSVETVRSILKQEHETTSLPYSRMLLAGFSQGGALSLYTGLSLESHQKLSGIVVMSGYLAGAKKFKLTPGLETTPILHCHGTSDPLVMYQMAEKSKMYVTSMGVKEYTIKSYQGMQHTVIPREIADVMEFLKKVLPPDENSCVKVKRPEEMSVKELKAAIRKAGLGSKAVGLMEKSEFVKLVKDFRENGKN